MNQDSLFELGAELEDDNNGQLPIAGRPARTSERAQNTKGDGLAPPLPHTDLAVLADQLAQTADPLETARLASQLRDAAEHLVASAIRDAEDAGATWRQIGAHLDKPFQTLHRRYGRR